MHKWLANYWRDTENRAAKIAAAIRGTENDLVEALLQEYCADRIPIIEHLLESEHVEIKAE